MTDPRQDEPEGEAAAEAPAPPQSAALELGTLQAPKGVEFTDPHSHAIYAWLVNFQKATRGVRVYADNNEMFHKFVDRAYDGLAAILDGMAELNLSVREDRLLFNNDPVHINADREDGLPFILYRNAFRRITLLRGMGRDELVSLMRAITTDYGGADLTGEDLVSALWRLSLPHLRYLTIDAISSTGGEALQNDEDAMRIQASIEDIVAAIYRQNAAESDDDVVAGVSITKEDLEALKEIRQESLEDLEVLDRATERAIADIPAAHVQVMRNALEGEDHDQLVRRVMDIFLRILFREHSGQASAGTIQIIQQLYDSMLFGGRFYEARELVQRLRESATSAEDLRELHISRHLLTMFSAEARVLPVLEAFNDEYGTSSVADKLRFLRALGKEVVPVLLANLETLSTPGHRRFVCELIVEFGVPEPVELMHELEGAKWFVARDILTLAQQHPLGRVSAIVASALQADHPKVRQHAVGMLRGYGRGLADKMLAERLRDDEIDVRLAAARVAAARRSGPCRTEIERLLSDEAIFDYEPRELRTLTASYAAIAGEEAVPALDRILSPGFFTRLKSLDAQIAAAFALGSIGGPAATAALQRGARTLNGKVREACKRALAKEFGRGESREDILAGRGLKIPDAATTSPNQPLPTRDDGAAPTPESGTPLAPPTPSRGNQADVDYTIGATSDVQDMLDGAPKFTLDLPSEEVPTVNLHPIERPRPSLPRVDPHNPVREAMPANLPFAPTADVELAPVPQREIIPDFLPPAPTGSLPPVAGPTAQTTNLQLDDEADDEGSQSAYEDIERELMDYLGVPAAEAPSASVAPEPTGPIARELTPVPPSSAARPRFGGAAADSGIFAGMSSADSSPDWGAPSGAHPPPEDVRIEPPLSVEEVPARAFGALPPSEAETQVSRMPPEAKTEPAARPPAREPAPTPAAVPIDDLFLDDGDSNS